MKDGYILQHESAEDKDEVLISELMNKYKINEAIELISERPFDLFSRATSHVSGKKCIFVSDKKYLEGLDSSVVMIITSRSIAESVNQDMGVCICENPRGLFFELLSLHEREDESDSFETIIGSGSSICSTARVSKRNVKIGSNVEIGEYVVIHPNTIIGDNVKIQTGARIAEQDFNVYQYKGINKQIYHSGKTIIGSNVLISSGVLIGQAMYSYGVTSIGDNCFIGANTCIGHNSQIEEDCEICGTSMIGGYCSIGKHSKLFMSVSIANNTTIGEGATINIGSVVVRNVDAQKTMFGNPAREIVIPK